MTAPAQPARPTKFNFDTVFGTKGAPSNAPSNRARSSYAADEVEVIRNEAFAAGKQAASAEIAQMQAMALTAVAQSTATLIQQFDTQISSMRAQSATLALSVGKKLAESAVEAFPHDETIELISSCMHKLHAEPRLVIRVASDTAEFIKSQIESLSEQNGFAGRVIVLVEPSLAPTACRIEWADGGVEQDMNATFAAIQEHVARWQSATSHEEILP